MDRDNDPVSTGRSFTLIKFIVTDAVVGRLPPSVTVTDKVYEDCVSKLRLLVDDAVPVQHVTDDDTVIMPVCELIVKRFEPVIA